MDDKIRKVAICGNGNIGRKMAEALLLSEVTCSPMVKIIENEPIIFKPTPYYHEPIFYDHSKECRNESKHRATCLKNKAKRKKKKKNKRNKTNK